MNFSKTQKIAYIALLIALQVVLGRFAGNYDTHCVN